MPDTPSSGETRRVESPEPTLVEGYIDLREVGRGGFGIVYRALQVEFNRTVALKVLTNVSDDPAARARFERECLAMGSLSGHPNIVTVYAAGYTIDGRPYIAMEFLAGGTLAERLAGRAISWSEAAAIGIKICGALQRAHDSGVLHRDVKPENVLVSDYDEPKLADFGIARLHGGYETRSGIVTATFAHAAPELLEGKPPSAASDVYSLASTLYQLITGHPPFVIEDEDTLPAVIARIATQPPPDLRDRGVPDSVSGALEHALAKDPAARTPTAAAFGRELQDAARAAGVDPTDMVVTAGGDRHPASARVTGLRRLGSRSRRTVVAVVLAGVLLVGGGVGLALALGGGSSGSTTPTTNSKIPLAPAMPTKLAGFQKDGAPSSSILRVFSGQPNYIADFPWTMNGCSSGTYTTQWRALTTADLVAAGPTDQHASTTLQASAVKGATTGHSGLITGDSCHEPVFFFAGTSSFDTLVDVAVVTQHWTAAP
ncbi:MAG TPA: serine/threonine-protein kinase [Acidimicrobiia bacterium]|nr:serine/threonine-protein kinase [Acidimicrobiia bacterium]